MHPVLLLILLGALLFTFSWYKRASGKKQKELRKKMLIGGGIALILLLLVTGRLNPVFAALAAAVPLGYRALSMWQTAKGFSNVFGSGGPGGSPGQQSAGQRSRVRTSRISMELDHDSGDMDGEVLRGRFKGRRLSSMSMPELLGLFNECRQDDPQSVALLEAYLDRTHGDAWRDQVAGSSGRASGSMATGDMSRSQAAEVLGLDPDADRETIIEAHRRLMQKLHPDRGGSNYLASQINRAKDVLLG